VTAEPPAGPEPVPPAGAGSRKSRPARAALWAILGLIRFYQRFLSPLWPPVCRFQPTCSAYALEALKRHGLWRGIWLTIRRLSRCHPFCKGGFDPVPERKDSLPEE
jgi:putative membrane protein insertion efficiency factor